MSVRRLRPALAAATLCAAATLSCGDEATTSHLHDTHLTDVPSGPGDTSSQDTHAPDTASEPDPDGADLITPPCPWEDYGQGLAGGPITWVGMDPRTDPPIGWATTASQLFRSGDLGMSWQPWTQGELGFGSLDFPTTDLKTIVGRAGEGFIVSHDRGTTFAVEALSGLGLSALLVHPASSQRVLVGTNGAGILRSNDGGTSFSPVNQGVPLSQIRSLAAPHDALNVVLAGVALLNPEGGFSRHGQILRSDDGGVTWEVALDGIGWANHIAYCTGDIVFAAVRDGAVWSRDGGLTWEALPAFDGLDTLHIAVDNTCTQLLVSVYLQGPWLSTDGGLTAEGPFVDGLDLDPTRISTNHLTRLATDPDVVLAATYGGLYRSQDGGRSWSLTNAGQGVAGSGLGGPVGADDVLLSTNGSGLWRRGRSDDGWTRIGREALPRDLLFAVHVDPRDPRHIILGTSREIWRSVDGGEHFSNLEHRGYNLLDVAFLDDGALLGATQTRGAIRSDDNGTTWHASNLGLTPWATSAGTFIDLRAIESIGGDVVIAGTNGAGLIRSVDGGRSWRPVAPAFPDARVRAIASRGSALYAVLHERGVAVSEDAGQTWVLSRVGLESLGMRALVVDPDSGVLYLALEPGGIYQSHDDGGHWTPLDRYCLPAEVYQALLITEDEAGRWLVAASLNGGVTRHRLSARE